MKYFKYILLIIFFNSYLFGLSNNLLQQTKKIDFTDTEQLWLKEHPKIKFATMSYWEVDNNGNNIHYKFIELLSKYSGINIIPIMFNKWENGYIEAKKENNIDGILGLKWSEQREKNDFFFTKPYDFTPYYIITNDKRINSIDDIKTQIIYIKKDSILKEFIKKTIPNIKIIELNDIKDIYNTLVKTQESAVAFIFDIDYKKIKQENLKVVETTYDKYGEISLGIPKENKILFSIITKVLNSIPNKELLSVRDKNKLTFSKEETKWLNKNLTIKYGFDPNYKPLEYKDDIFNHLGIIADIFELIKSKVNLNLVSVAAPSNKEVFEFLKDKKIDMISAVGKTKDNKKYLKFSKNNLYSTPYVFVAKKDLDLNDGFNSILDKKVATIAYHSVVDLLKEFTPTTNLILKDNIKDLFKGLVDDTIDVVVLDAITAQYYIDLLALNEKDISIVYKTIFNLDLKIAFAKDAPKELISILDKILQTISSKQINDIVHKWTSIKVKEKTDWLFILKIAIVIIILIGLLFLNNKKLKSLVEAKTADIVKQKNELENLLRSFDKNVISSKTDLKGNITDISLAFCKLSGYKANELIGKPHSILGDPSMPKDIFIQVWRSLQNEMPIIEEIRNLKKDKTPYWLEVRFSPDYNTQGNLIGYSSIAQDITSKKEVEELSKNLEKKVIERTHDLHEAKNTVEKMLKDTKDSIEYASLIQHALIPNQALFEDLFEDFFTFWRPKDIVGGDIYLFERLNENESILMVIDCTGHGVPGAFVTMLVKAIERQVIAILNSKEVSVISPAWILEYFNKTIKNLLNQEDEHSISNSNAGFDGGILYYNKKDKIIKYAGAETPLFIIQDGKSTVLKTDRHSVGYKKSDKNYKYKEHIIDVSIPTKLYITTDGYIDQKGGTKGFPYGKKKFLKSLEENLDLNMQQQKELLIKIMKEYQGDYFTVDDNTVIGLEI